MIVNFIVFALVGRLIIFLWNKFPLSIWLASKVMWMGKLFDCDLCFGVWIYTILAFFFRINIFENWFYFVGLSEFLTGAITSFIMYLVKNGWDTRFRVLELK